MDRRKPRPLAELERRATAALDRALRAGAVGVLIALVCGLSGSWRHALLAFGVGSLVCGQMALVGRAVDRERRRRACDPCPHCGEHAAEPVVVLGFGYQFHRCWNCNARFRDPTHGAPPPPPRYRPRRPNGVWAGAPDPEEVAADPSGPLGPLVAEKHRAQSSSPPGPPRRILLGPWTHPVIGRRLKPSPGPGGPVQGERNVETLGALLRRKQRLGLAPGVEDEPKPDATAEAPLTLWDRWIDP